jgi:hypothetical protein
MKSIISWRSAIAALLFFVGTAAASAGEPAKEDAAFSAKLFGAIGKSDYDAFVADGSEAFRGITRAQFDLVCAQLAPKLKASHTITFLGELNQHGFRVTLWKVVFSDGSDDALATLSVKDGKVGGFWIR